MTDVAVVEPAGAVDEPAWPFSAQLADQRRQQLRTRLPVYRPEQVAQLRAASADVKRQALEMQVERLRRLAPHSLEAHARLFHRDDRNRPLVAWPHQLEWIRVFEAVEQHRWVVLIVPPGYGKSTWASTAYPAWEIGRTHGQTRIGLVSNTGGLAFAFADAVKNTIQTAEYQAVYDVAPDVKRGWGRGQFFVTGAPAGKDPSLLASGIGGASVLGRRFDTIVLDDPTTWENARSSVTMEKHRHWLKTTLLSRFPPGKEPPDGDGRMLVVLTRWAEQDLVGEFEELGFQIIRMPAVGYWDRTVDDAGDVHYGGAPLWPELHPLDQLRALAEQDEIVFELVYQGNVGVLAGDTFDVGKFNYAPPPRRKDLSRVVQFVDTASGKDRTKGDYCVIATLGVRNANEVWVLDVDRDRYPAPEQQRRVAINAEKHDPDLIVVEDANEGTALYQNMVVSSRLPLKLYSPGSKDKEWRAIPWANAVNGGQAWLPDRSKWAHAFVMEHKAFPKGKNDDQVDAAAGAFTHLVGDRGPRVRSVGG